MDNVSEPGLYSDRTLPGFRLKVTAPGAKVYQMYGKVKGGTVMVKPDGSVSVSHAPVRVTIGQHGSKCDDGTDLTEAKARKEAGIIKGEMLKGVNRNSQRKTDKKSS